MGEKTESIKEAIKEVLSIPGNHSCRDNPYGICPVTSAVSDDVVFVEKPFGVYCPYYIPFGNSGFCDFSARKKLYSTYGV